MSARSGAEIHTTSAQGDRAVRGPRPALALLGIAAAGAGVTLALALTFAPWLVFGGAAAVLVRRRRWS